MKKIKHSKYRNTALLYEILIRKVMVDVMDGINESKALPIIKKYFKKNSTLNKELQLYNYLVTEKFDSDIRSNHLLEAIVKSRIQLSVRDINKQKYNLIKEMKETLDVTSLFEYRIKNYKTLASIYKLFEYTEADNPIEISKSKTTILEHMSKKQGSKKKDLLENIPEALKDKDIRILTYKILVEKFNKKYGSVLDEVQKEILREYISNVSNTPMLKEFLDTKITDIKFQLKKLNNKVTSNVVKIKLSEAIKVVDTLKSRKYVKDTDVSIVLKYYELIKELKIQGDK